jgi:hypothetical protein
MSDILDAISPELARRNPALLAQLRGTRAPTNDQSDAVVHAPYEAMSENYGPRYVPNQRGKDIDNAIGAYLLAWPIYR